MTHGITRDRSAAEIVEERTQHIAAMMRRLEWVRGKSNRDLATKWNCSVAAVNDYAAEASRIVRREVTDPVQVTETVTVTLQECMRRSMETAQYGNVAKTADVWTRIVGARAPERHEHSVVVSQYEQMPPREKAAFLREQAQLLLDEADALDPPILALNAAASAD